jgi:CRP-like cAMP-binding protein
MDTHPLTSAYCGGNAILDRLSPHEREDLLSHMSVYIEEEGSVLRARNRPIDAVHFPIDAVYSVVVELSQGHTYEVDVIGRAGVVGAEIAIGAEIASRTVLCQAGGRVAKLQCERFIDAIGQNRPFLVAVRESLRWQWFDSQQTVACNFTHTIEQRAARWILMTQDQIGREHFPLRAEFLSIMLGVTAAMVRDPLAVLVHLGCICYADDYVTVVSREALREHACECYDLHKLARCIPLDGDVLAIEHIVGIAL